MNSKPTRAAAQRITGKRSIKQIQQWASGAVQVNGRLASGQAFDLDFEQLRRDGAKDILVEQLNEKCYRAVNQRNGNTYSLFARPSHIECTCPDYTYRVQQYGRVHPVCCKHGFALLVQYFNSITPEQYAEQSQADASISDASELLDSFSGLEAFDALKPEAEHTQVEVWRNEQGLLRVQDAIEIERNLVAKFDFDEYIAHWTYNILLNGSPIGRVFKPRDSNTMWIGELYLGGRLRPRYERVCTTPDVPSAARSLKARIERNNEKQLKSAALSVPDDDDPYRD